MRILLCLCECSKYPNKDYCEVFVRYYEQDVAKAHKLHLESQVKGFTDGFLIAYKKCGYCKFMCGPLNIY